MAYNLTLLMFSGSTGYILHFNNKHDTAAINPSFMLIYPFCTFLVKMIEYLSHINTKNMDVYTFNFRFTTSDRQLRVQWFCWIGPTITDDFSHRVMFLFVIRYQRSQMSVE